MAISRSGPNRARDRSNVSQARYLAISCLDVLKTPMANRLAEHLRAGNDSEVVAASIKPQDYSSPYIFYADWMAVNLMSKSVELQLSIDTEKVAMQTFLDCEVINRISNDTLSRPSSDASIASVCEPAIMLARRKILGLIGESPDMAKIEKFFGFSSGASTRLRRRRGHAYYKFLDKPDVTPLALRHAIVAVSRIPLWKAQMISSYGNDPLAWFNIVPGNAITTVEKNAKTKRVIAIEPCMNMFMQRGVGGFFRTRLRSVGIDLDDQSVNQRLAWIASKFGWLATVDLKSASDTICLALCYQLLPPAWYDLIDVLRSHIGKLPDGTYHRYEKVSSMGNGFTFELESLLFWALSEGLTDNHGFSRADVAVYGDDIIIPAALVPNLKILFSYCGFTLNMEKSFWDGPFRESCGKHYFAGVDVTPLYIKDRIDNPTRVYWFVNAYRQWASRLTDGLYACASLSSPYEKAVKLLKSRDILYVPITDGDSGIHSTFSEALPSYDRKRQCWKYTKLLPCSTTRWGDGFSAVLAATQGSPQNTPPSVLVDLYKQRGAKAPFDYVGLNQSLPSRSMERYPSSGLALMSPVNGRFVRRKARTSRWEDPPIWWNLGVSDILIGCS